jgi:hypothetical protein
MKDQTIKDEFDDIRSSIDRLERKIEPQIKIQLTDEVRHSLIWGVVAVCITGIICWTIVWVHS